MVKNKILLLCLFVFSKFNYGFDKDYITEKKHGCLVGQYETNISPDMPIFGYTIVKLYRINENRYLMVCECNTYKDAKDDLSQWFQKSLTSNSNVINCSNLRSGVIKQIHNNFGDGLKKSPKDMKEVFFRVNEFHKSPIARTFGYLLTSKHKNVCYTKFKDMFGAEALQIFKESCE